MAKKIFLAALLLVLTSAGRAEAAVDYLIIAYQRTLYPARMVLLYDQCVEGGFIDPDDDSGISAQVRFQSYIDKESKRKDQLRHKDVSDDDVADAMQRAFKTVKKQVLDHPMKLDPQMCYMLHDTWPVMVKRYDLEPASDAPPAIPGPAPLVPLKKK